jgi:putative colanic acid biosynthesis glycosyltransferase WcaI
LVEDRRVLDREPVSTATSVQTQEAAIDPLRGSGSGQRILIVGINYAPELTGIAPYTTAVAEHYASQGHVVRVVTGTPHYPEWRRMPAPTRRPGSNPTVARYWHFVPGRANALQRVLYEATWLVSASRGVLGSPCDIVIGIVPNLADGMIALIAGRRWGAPVGLVVKDLVGPAAAQSGYRGGGIVAGMTKGMEQFVARHADQIAVISHGFQRYLEKAGIRTNRIHRVCDWRRDGAPAESVPETRTRLRWAQNEFICLHAGNMGQKQGLNSVLQAARILDGTGIKIVLSGDGNDRVRLQERARQLALSNLTFVDLQPPGKYEAMLRAADVLLLNQRPSVGDMSLPSKLASYFGSGRPVVAAIAENSEAAHEVKDADAGIVVPAGDAGALAAALSELRRSPQTARDFGLRGESYASRNLNADSALVGYDVFLNALLASRPVR